jgi:segregation and condensation protein A
VRPDPGAPAPDGGAFESFLSVSQEASGVGYAVKLPAFEGPLDLLLHLIKLNEVDVTDIPIARIAEQYLGYLDLMRDLHLDVAAEYLVMAATLAWIKSRMLLPPDGVTEEDEGPDPRADLVARILEYQRFKAMAGDLDARLQLGRDVFAPRLALDELAPPAEPELEVSLFHLLEAMQRVLAAAKSRGVVHEVLVEPITVRERMIALMDALATSESLEFMEALRGPAGESPTVTLIVTSFLAVLELTRLQAIRVYQGMTGEGVPEGPIRLRRASADSGWNERISELM